MTVTPGAARSRLDPEPVARRDFLGLASLGAAIAALLFATIGMLRLPKAAVLSSPSRKFRVTLPDTLAEGTAYVPPGRSVALFRDGKKIYAISTTYTKNSGVALLLDFHPEFRFIGEHAGLLMTHLGLNVRTVMLKPVIKLFNEFLAASKARVYQENSLAIQTIQTLRHL